MKLKKYNKYMMSDKYYCPSCGEKVETAVRDYGRGQEICCVYCGFPILAVHVQQFSYKQSVIIVDDSKLLVEMMKDYFEKNSLTKTLHLCYDGGAFVKQFTKSLYEGEDIGLVILDIMMPILSGINAAIAMRAIEQGFDRERIPILFFSAKKADEQLIAAMKYCAPAHYVCKVEAEDSKELCERVYKVANNLLLESKLMSGKM